MHPKGPHISIDSSTLVPRFLRISTKDFEEWPESVRQLAITITRELFLVRYNPFIPPDVVKKSVWEQFESARRGLAHHYATSISEGIAIFWSAHEGDMAFRKEILARLSSFLPAESMDTRGYSLVDNATDATDLRLELPLLVLTPTDANQISKIVHLANEMQFALVPRGGGSGATGGAVPARKRSVILSLTKLTKIIEIDEVNKTLTAQAGVITNDAIKAAAKQNLLFSVDPASKIASSIGGNVAENAGGPLCFEYGTTIDNLLSYRMVTPTGELIEIIRKDHPRCAIAPDDNLTFEVRDMSGGLRSVIKLAASEVRTPGLGKDVTNKALGGLPGVQKEGTDGVIIDATFTLHDILPHIRVLVFEFFGRSMESCMLVVNDIVALRNDIRRRGDLVKITALEEFNIKYVQAIGYKKKSDKFEGDPISVLTVQLDSNDLAELDDVTAQVQSIAQEHAGVDSFVAKDDKEAELFWEDRHKLSAIAKRTSGFKINEDVVIPNHAIPDFALFLEALNLEWAARAYRTALKAVEDIAGITDEDQRRIIDEIAYANRIIQKDMGAGEISDSELQLHAALFLHELAEGYPKLAEKLEAIEKYMVDACICVASHMHAGDGNCHVNIPVNSSDFAMVHNAEQVAAVVMAKAQSLGGEVTGEHGIGITKIAFLTEAKMEAFKEYKLLVDPRNIFNPAKLTQRTMPGAPFTFSFNSLIKDLSQSGLEDKDRLIELLKNIQVCTRCGKCKQHCPMHFPEQSLQYHPRNKNLVLGALIEAIYYTQVNNGKPDMSLLRELQVLVEHCTGCGKCTTVCPVKIKSSEVALTLRGILEEEGAGANPIKAKVLHFITGNPSNRIPAMAKLASIGQAFSNSVLRLVPKGLKEQFESPLFSGLGPVPDSKNLRETLQLDKSSLFVPQGEVKGTVLYFPGCGGAIFFRHIGIGGIALLLRAGYAVALPEKHLCCGYPLLAAGAHEAFAVNQDNNIRNLRALAKKTAAAGYPISHVLTACGSCRDGMERHFVPEVFPEHEGEKVLLDDMVHFLLQEMPAHNAGQPLIAPSILYHSPCHSEVPNVHKVKAAGIYAKGLEKHFGAPVNISPGCCGESGMGAITSPAIYNKIRGKKAAQLTLDLQHLDAAAPIVVGCPSCKMGISRILLNQGVKRKVMHSIELMAEEMAGDKWRRKFKKTLRGAPIQEGTRIINANDLAFAELTEAERTEEHEND